MKTNLAHINKLHHKKQLDLSLVAQADEIIKQCRVKLSLVTDPDIKSKLDIIIESTGVILNDLLQDADKGVVGQHALNLKLKMAQLPSKLPQRANMASVSLQIAKASVFVLAFSLAITTGFAFHAWYFSYLSTAAFVEYLADTLAIIGIPATSLGLFSFGLFKFSDEPSNALDDLQYKVDDFGNAAVDTAREVTLSEEDAGTGTPEPVDDGGTGIGMVSQ